MLLVQSKFKPKTYQGEDHAISPATLVWTTSSSRFGCLGCLGFIARLTGTFAAEATTFTVCVCVCVCVVADPSTQTAEDDVEVNDAAALTPGAKRVLCGFLLLAGDGGFDAECVERGFAGLAFVPDLARGLHTEAVDFGDAWTEDGPALGISTSSSRSVSDTASVPRVILARLDACERVRMLLWLAPSSSSSVSVSESASAPVAARRVRFRDPGGSWQRRRAQGASLSSWIVESARKRARLRSVVCSPS